MIRPNWPWTRDRLLPIDVILITLFFGQPQRQNKLIKYGTATLLNFIHPTQKTKLVGQTPISIFICLCEDKGKNLLLIILIGCLFIQMFYMFNAALTPQRFWQTCCQHLCYFPDFDGNMLRQRLSRTLCTFSIR